MKLCEEVKSVLDVACPVWMKKLCEVDFDIKKLSGDDRYTLESVYTSCFIGEIHHKDGMADQYDYMSSNSHCGQCVDLACGVPSVFADGRFGYKLYDHEGGRHIQFESDIDGRTKLLKFIADHVKQKHPELMNKKPVENDC